MANKSKFPDRLREGLNVALERSVPVLRPAALPVAFLVFYGTGVWGLWQYSAGRACRPTMPHVDTRQCQWLAPADVAAINSRVGLTGCASIFDRDLCAQVADSYRESPWVEQVVAVRRHFPDRLEVELAVRQPFASVKYGGQYLLVDHLGCRLPVLPAARPDSLYPVIGGVIAAPPGAGEIWNDECLNDSLLLAGLLKEVLAGCGPTARLASIVAEKPASGRDLLPQMTAATVGGTKIDWGSFNETSTVAFPSVSEKRAELERQLRLIADLSAVDCIKVHHRNATVVPRQQPIATGSIGMNP